MPVFEYRGTNPNGQPASGTLFCASMGAAVEDLTQRGFTIEHLQISSGLGDPLATQQSSQSAPADTAPTQAGGQATQPMAIAGPAAPPRPETPSTTPRTPTSPENISPLDAPRSAMVTDFLGHIFAVPLPALLFFFRQLATMLNAGVGMVGSLDTLSTQTSDPRLRAAIQEFRLQALEGRPLTYGLSRYPEIFSPLMLSMVRAGEDVGRIDESLKLVARHIEEEIALRNLYKRVTFYPKFVVIASIAIVLATNLILGALGKGPGLSSPLTEPATWVVLLPLIVLAFFFFRVGVKQPRIRVFYDQFIQKVPALGKTMHQFAMAKFGRAFGTLYAGGVPIQRAALLAADSCGNEYMRQLVYPAAKQIEEGGSMAEAFARTGAFSPIVLDMMRTGETTGNVDMMMQKMADFYEDEANTRAIQMGHIFGVVCLICVAMYIGYIVFSFWSGYAAGFGGEMG
ncbi:MAG: type II secretion system F family protein [Armatimonadetes bacterium]|nr:type II secretion system F family protein [Armatimonadota bacterium]